MVIWNLYLDGMDGMDGIMEDGRLVTCWLNKMIKHCFNKPSTFVQRKLLLTFKCFIPSRLDIGQHKCTIFSITNSG